MTPRARLRRSAAGNVSVRTLLIHGVAGSPAVWDGFVSRASDQLELWDVELPWAGAGDRQWALRDIPDTIDSVLRSLPERAGGQAPVDLIIAHSFGASALLELLAVSPRPHADRVVLVAPLTCPEPFDWSEISRRVEEFPLLLEEGIGRRARRLSPPMRRELAERLRDLIGPLPWLRTYEYGLRSALLDTTRLTMPILVLTGSADRVTAAVDVERLAGRLPDARLELLVGSGHFPMIDREREFTDAVNEFATSHEEVTELWPARA
ncbi:alpha/beta fold hydrolase [Rhodococcus oryzae]|uniref:alpha/beta fold hydrolase n=1 Tax=Rhodococcus oryzae TaxID=2571143 RepID=UPI0037B05D48